jgi:alcohol dehydrogenase class IV
MTAWRYCVPTAIYFGRGMFGNSGDLAQLLGERPLIVTGRRAARSTGMLEALLEQVPAAIVFDGVEENPGTLICERGAALCREHHCDAIIALGGGSAMDAAKAIAVLATNPGRCVDYLGAEKYSAAPLPIAAIPTTSGTGSEVTPYAVLVNEADNTKRTISGAALYPRVAICDPELTLTMPRAVTLATGLDALSQCMEGIVSRAGTPLGDVLAMEGICLLREHLPRVLAAPDDLDAREQVMFAALLSGCVIAQSGTTIVHGMGYAYTCHFNIAHGLANALLLAPVFHFNARHLPAKVARIAGALGAQDLGDPAAAITTAIHALLNACDVDPAASAHGAERGKLLDFTRELLAEPYRFKNQYGDFTEGSLHALYLASYEGRV